MLLYARAMTTFLWGLITRTDEVIFSSVPDAKSPVHLWKGRIGLKFILKAPALFQLGSARGSFILQCTSQSGAIYIFYPCSLN